VDRPFVALTSEDLQRPLIEQLERMVIRAGDRPAISDADRTLSFAQLWAAMSGLSERIAASSRPGELIGILLPDCSLYPLALLACLAAGRPFMALDVRSPADWLARILREVKPALILTSGPWPARERGTQVINLTALPRPAGPGWRPASLGVDEPACVLLTSGSTGRPKAVVNSQRGLLQRIAQAINAGHINTDDRVLSLASLSTIVGVRDVLTALLAGASVHVVDSQRAAAREMRAVLSSQEITILFAFPALLRSLVPRDGEKASATLRMLRVGGDTLLWSDLAALRAWLTPRCLIQIIYAATEAPIMQWFVDGTSRGDDPRVPIGYPLPGNRVALIDELGRAVAPGDAGELIVASPCVTLGSWAEGRFLPYVDPMSPAPGSRVFRTGDLVRQRPDGLLERLGRKDRQVKIRGTRVELEGVEAALRQHPRLRDVGVVARPGGEEAEATLVAYVSAREGNAPGLIQELRELMRSHPPAMRPGRIYQVGEIPRLPSSKLDMLALRRLDEARLRQERTAVADALQSGSALDHDGIAGIVAKAWHAVLHAPALDPEQDFFDSGGDSLKAIRLLAELERALGLELPATLLSETPRFASLCEVLKRKRTPGYVPLVLLKPGAGRAPVFLVHGLGGNVAELFPLARSMTYPGAVFAVQARGLNHRERPHTRIRSMAAEYLRAIKAQQPEGPYHLCGYSFGGLVAFEMARQLSTSGEKIGLICLLDTLPSPLRWPSMRLLTSLCRRILRSVAHLPAPPLRSKRLLQAGSLRAGATAMLKSTRSLWVALCALLAGARYRPGFYPGALRLLTPLERDPDLPDPRALWAGHAREILASTTPGRHLTMLAGPHARLAAEQLTAALAIASRGDLL
jgi:acyl-coenzyme A synthetase/AMP-(fatty) acid ligase/thioesterase domain-containing protein/acyl carrier protein